MRGAAGPNGGPGGAGGACWQSRVVMDAPGFPSDSDRTNGGCFCKVWEVVTSPPGERAGVLGGGGEEGGFEPEAPPGSATGGGGGA